MCGICGTWNLNSKPIDAALLARMRDTMVHRGPDGAACVVFDVKGSAEPVLFEHPEELKVRLTDGNSRASLGLAHRRLSIIDLSTGDQPMCNEDRTIWIVYNGEVYNYRELRQQLQARGHAFRTMSDTEVVIHAYEEYGEQCPGYFNGIFAFAIWDARRRVLFLARDAWGVKPLYYYYNAGRQFQFASEMKAILCDSDVPRVLDLNALNLCLTFRHTPSPWTLFTAIRKLQPGCFLSVTSEGVRSQQYVKDATLIDRGVSQDVWVERLRMTTKRAVERQMVSDVPIGLSLSSGVDSSCLLALMAQHSREPVRAFTVGFAGRETTSEIEPARQLAEQYGAQFFDRLITSDDYASFMGRYISHLEEPIGNDSAPAYYFVAEMARAQGVKVLLVGQGPDEVFAGYGRHLWAAYSRWLRLGAVWPLRRALSHALAGTRYGEQYQRFLVTLDGNSEAARFLRVYSLLSDQARYALVRPEIMAQVDRELPCEYVRDQLSRAPSGTPLERMTYVDARSSLPDNLLLCEDKLAMAASVEARVPFLDLEFMEIAEQVPGSLKLHGWRDKYIHRKACASWVGHQIASRRKIGFDNALDLWLRAQLGDWIAQIAETSGSFTATYLNPQYVRALIQEHAGHQRDHRRILFLLLSLEKWYDVFM